MALKPVKTDRAPQAIGPYSQAIIAGGFVFVSGQIPVNPADGSIAPIVTQQAEQAFTNLGEVLKAAGSSLVQVVKTTVFLQDMADFAIVNEIYARFFSEPYPARSCVQAAKLPRGVLIEVEAIAAL